MSVHPVVERILAELVEMKQIVTRIKEGMQKLKQTNDSLYLDSVALNLQGFYNGIEILHRRLINTFPKGECGMLNS